MLYHKNIIKKAVLRKTTLLHQIPKTTEPKFFLNSIPWK